MIPRVADAARALLGPVALFFGAFAAVNAVRAAIDPALDGNGWWIDVRGVPAMLSAPVLAGGGALLCAWAVVPAMGQARRAATVIAAALLAVVTASNAIDVVSQRNAGGVETDVVPFSALLALGFAGIAALAARDAAPRAPRRVPLFVCAVAVALVFPVVQQVTFGRSDYRRRADAIVVFGARAYADGRPSVALADRVRTASALWREGRAPVLILSGGPGDGAVHETEAMRRLAIDEGVDAGAIVADAGGLDTASTAGNAADWARAHGAGRVLAVSHAYHLPRVRLAFDRAGVAAFTVPARESRALPRLPWYAIRDAAAWWVAWARV